MKGGVYSGWAPLPPVGITVVAPDAYVFVDSRYITSYRVYGFIRPARENITIVSRTHVIGRTEIVGGRATTHTMTRTIQAAHPTKFRSTPHKSAQPQGVRSEPRGCPAAQKTTPAHPPRPHPQQKATPQRTTPQQATPQHAAPQHVAPAKPAPESSRKEKAVTRILAALKTRRQGWRV